MLARGTPLPMWDHYEKHQGYYFEPSQLKEAENCAELIRDYIAKNVTKKKQKGR
jgi:hypothetical protein